MEGVMVLVSASSQMQCSQQRTVDKEPVEDLTCSSMALFSTRLSLHQQKPDLPSVDWPGPIGCLVLQLGSGAQELMMHGSVPAEASFFFLFYICSYRVVVFIFVIFVVVFMIRLLVSKSNISYSVLSHYCLVYI